MDLATWWLFFAMTFVVSATPGPNMLLVMRSSARFGVRAAVATMAGCMSALLVMMSVSAAGLGALLQALPAVFDVLRLGGAAYLAYLGVVCWRTPVQEGAPDPTAAPVASHSAWALYRQGAMVAASNPKAMLFAAAFFPQFIHADKAPLPQFAILLATFTVIEVSWYFVYGISGHKLSKYLQQAPVMCMFNRVTGGAFIGFAGLMAATRA
jgi:threonine/homoserine/homoserine lactone efflux protein